MTEILSSVAQPFFGRATIDDMPNDATTDWRHQYHYPMTGSTPWPDHNQGSPAVGTLNGDHTIYDQRHEQSYAALSHYYDHQAPQFTSPSFGYHGDDVEMLTPSTGFGTDATEGYHPTRHSDSFLRPPTGHGFGSLSPKSTTSTPDTFQSQSYFSSNSAKAQRPGMSRSNTAPEPQQTVIKPTSNSSTKRKDSSDEDDDYVPGAEDAKPTNGTTASGRGRKRQRIPHTAVERRYRENLNAHLEKLRQSVPSLAQRGGSTGAKEASVKPSKCEILNGAIEYIANIERENRGLRDEVKMMNARMEDVEKWKRSNHSKHHMRGGGY